MKIATIDFETYWAKDYSLRSKDLNMSEYVLDDQFKAHMMGIKIDDGATIVVGTEDIQSTLDCIDWSDTAGLAHNTAFDGFILSQHYNVVPAKYYDTLSMSRGMFSVAYSLDLDSVAHYCDLGRGKLPDILKESKGVRELPMGLYERMAEYCARDVDLTYDVFRFMIDKYPPAELDLIDLTLRMFTDPVLLVDLPRVQLALEAEMGKKVGALLKASVRAEDLMSNQKFAKLLEERGLHVPMKVSLRTGLPAPAFAKNDLGFMHLRKDPRAAPLIEARLAIKSTIGETRAGRLLKVGDAQLPVLLNYCGAHTTRWSAGNKMNLQNLPRKGELRKSILAPPGHAIVVADSAQIEARVLAWLSRNIPLLEIFANKGDPYRWQAATAYKKLSEDISPDERFIGKVLTLGLGFGMGPTKLQETLAKGALGAEPMVVSLREAERLVEAYREANPAVVQLWGEMKELIRHMSLGLDTMYGPLEVVKEAIILPSGLALQYPDLKITQDDEKRSGYTYTNRSVRARIYGGLLSENVVQALARCIVADQMLAIAKKYRVVSMTHDEIIAVAPLAEADDAVKFMLEEMTKPPAWAPDLPLGAEGGWDVMYSK